MTTHLHSFDYWIHKKSELTSVSPRVIIPRQLASSLTQAWSKTRSNTERTASEAPFNFMHTWTWGGDRFEAAARLSWNHATNYALNTMHKIRKWTRQTRNVRVRVLADVSITWFHLCPNAWAAAVVRRTRIGGANKSTAKNVMDFGFARNIQWKHRALEWAPCNHHEGVDPVSGVVFTEHFIRR